MHHMGEAAGHPMARHNLRCTEEDRGGVDRAAKHDTIAAKRGYELHIGCSKEDIQRWIH